MPIIADIGRYYPYTDPSTRKIFTVPLLGMTLYFPKWENNIHMNMLSDLSNKKAHPSGLSKLNPRIEVG